MTTKISKTQYVFTLLHRTGDPPESLWDALEMSEEQAVGQERHVRTSIVLDGQVSYELQQLGNDGTFFDEDLAEM